MSEVGLRVVIVDDEPLVREGIRRALEADSGVEVVAECGNGDDAVREIRSRGPDLAFLDVRMPGLDGFEVLERLGPDERPWVIFVTAHDEYALAAFRANAVDYILKPFSAVDVRDAVDRARALLRGTALEALDARLARLIETLPAPTPYLRRFTVRIGLRLVVVDVEETDYLEADGNYVQIHTRGARWPARDTLKSLERRLDPADWVRIHRSYLIRADRVRELRAAGGERWEVLLEDGTRLPASESGRERLIRALDPGGSSSDRSQSG